MISRFLNFDKLLGSGLIKILYYLGLIGIALGFIISFLGSLWGLTQDFGAGLMGLIVTVLGTLLAAVFWRFLCEIYLLFFRMADDLRDIKNHQLGRAPNDVEVNVGS